MLFTFVRLKLRLLRNTLRINKQAAFGFWGGMAVVALFVVMGFGVLWEIDRDTPAVVEPLLICMGAVLALMWIVVPLTVGYTDGTIDPLRLTSLPLSRRRLVVGLLAAAVTSPMPFFTFALFHAPVVYLRSVPSIVFLTVAAFVGTVLVVVLSQLAAAATSALIRNRGTRDLMSMVLMTVAVSLGLGAQFAATIVGVSADRWWSFARWLRWSPGGWLGQAVVWSQQSRWLPAVLALVGTCVAIAVFITVWARLLDRLLTTKPQQVSTPAPSDRRSDAVVRGVGWLPKPLDVTTSRALRSLRRDHREWAGIITSVPLMLFAAIPLARVDDGEATLLVAGAGSYLGLAFMALFAFDGSAVWLDLTAARSMRPVLVGKCLARLVLILPLLVLAAVGVAWLTGGWLFLPAAVVLAVAALLVMIGIGANISVRNAVAMPDMANQFSGGAGQGAAAAAFFGALFLGILLAVPPTALVTLLSYWRWWAGLLAAPLALAYGIWIGWAGIRRAGDRATREGPELLARLAL